MAPTPQRVWSNKLSLQRYTAFQSTLSYRGCRSCHTAAPESFKVSKRGQHRNVTTAGVGAFLQGQTGALHNFITIYPWPFYIMMALLPHTKLTRRLLMGGTSLLPLAILYALMLAAAWAPDTFGVLFPGSWSAGLQALMAGKPEMQFIPTVKAVGNLLSRPLAALSAWAHLQFISFFCARWIWMDGLAKGVVTTHSVLLCGLVAPLGFLSHVVTCSIYRWLARSAPAQGLMGALLAPSEADLKLPGAASSATVDLNGKGRGGNGAHIRDATDTDRARALAVGNGAEDASQAQIRDNEMAGRVPGSGQRSGESVGQGGPRRKEGNSSGDDRSWLTILEPEYVQQGSQR